MPSEDDKKKRRLASNRKSALKSRYRQMVYLEELSKNEYELKMKCDELHDENEKLKKVIASLANNETGKTCFLQPSFTSFGPELAKPIQQHNALQHQAQKPHNMIAPLPQQRNMVVHDSAGSRNLVQNQAASFPHQNHYQAHPCVSSSPSPSTSWAFNSLQLCSNNLNGGI
uniref:BZIP domain-containing protein n=1 Tax=Trieres chinensis TaxID=1514140 RepID=A0A7S2ELY4_TRICV|mmetsp:Transcript_30193/g.61578  ORF Transcript_30193/g.61578 Transcript_30193/m.61578 type:complete len:171 (+) Transcript_30193:79-591(+)|eukprot:CAMPEP_0183297604 /NCGR_PEP_ID=MMETSP0160_2-20130417/4844_1 /TAXON_ID=2839 ORGANISM="Odontella Sinensis, Strain Grunow 1884" /NCGR_SAMPLE_ID=MMETSP0160_2 /ASSEMBLY_ACC=CAM_ASM_000250 /LENGTH=170 /DNA_ID=CAMNT_0025459453 /DNA_START=67 /DNA_END=579 /DNA_ORIENTATION=-